MSIFSSKIGEKLRKILFVASEAAPYAKVGGLGEVMSALPKTLRNLGCDARVMIPKYATIDTARFPMELELGNIQLAGPEKDPYGLLVCNVLRHKDEKGETISYFLENMEYFEKRANIYGYNDDTARWLVLSKGVIEFIRRSEWKPDIVVSSDWQAGFIPNLLEIEYKNDPVLSKIATVFSIHNLRYQGMLDPHFASQIDYDSGQGDIPDFFAPGIEKLNGMRRGILYADVVNTVSPTYAKEILLPQFGEKLDGVLQERKGRLFGILNGIDYEYYNPETDPVVPYKYSAANFKDRSKNKAILQERVGLPRDENKFIVSFVGRLDEQKGIGLLSNVVNSLFENIDFQMVILGTGGNEYKLFFQDLQKQFPDRVSVNLFFDAELPKLMFSGSDSFLLPSQFEPCGLVQLEAMRYGAIPIVRKVGGLADSVADYVPCEDKGTGFVFEKYEDFAFLIAMVRAYETFRNKKEWGGLIKRAMHADFSWKKSAEEYIKLFENAMRLHGEH